jgi:hypothetical protein
MTATGWACQFRAPNERPESTQLSPSRRRLRTAGVGHEDTFPRPTLSARCRISQRTFARTRGNGRDAPIADLGPLTQNGEV